MPRGADLDRLVRDLDTAGARVMGACARATEKALLDSAEEGYRQRRDVHGEKYLLPKDGHVPPMERSGRLRRSYTAKSVAGPTMTRTTLSEDTPYGQYLRDGTSKMEPRQHMPRPSEPLPATWDRRVRAGIERAVEREARR